jgi:MFS family permease
LGLVIGIFSFVALLGRLIAGPLADRRGRKISFLAGLGLLRGRRRHSTCCRWAWQVRTWRGCFKAWAKRVSTRALPRGLSKWRESNAARRRWGI